MENKKKDLAKVALSALLLAASLPAASQAGEVKSQGVILAAGCGAQSCGASDSKNTGSNYNRSNEYSGTGSNPSRSINSAGNYGARATSNDDMGNSYDKNQSTINSTGDDKTMRKYGSERPRGSYGIGEEPNNYDKTTGTYNPSSDFSNPTSSRPLQPNHNNTSNKWDR